jgi:hypothetical protein
MKRFLIFSILLTIVPLFAQHARIDSMCVLMGESKMGEDINVYLSKNLECYGFRSNNGPDGRRGWPLHFRGGEPVIGELILYVKSSEENVYIQSGEVSLRMMLLNNSEGREWIKYIETLPGKKTVSVDSSGNISIEYTTGNTY